MVGKVRNNLSFLRSREPWDFIGLENTQWASSIVPAPIGEVLVGEIPWARTEPQPPPSHVRDAPIPAGRLNQALQSPTLAVFGHQHSGNAGCGT